MTEERFELKWRDTGEVLYDNETGLEKGIYSPKYRFHVRDMMNELNNENKSLKAEIEQLKKCYNNVLNELDTLAEIHNKTHEENEKLKGQLKDCSKKAKEEIRKQEEENAIRWANIGR